jgi:hypothetical protein
MLDNLSVFAKRRPDGARLGAADSLTKDQRSLLALSNRRIKVSEAAVDAADEAALQEALMQSAAGAGYAPLAPRKSSPTQPAGSRMAPTGSPPVPQRSWTGSTLRSPLANSSTTTLFEKSMDENSEIDDEKRLQGSPQFTGAASKGQKRSNLISFFSPRKLMEKFRTVRAEIVAENAARRQQSAARIERDEHYYPSAPEQERTGDGRWG